MSAPHSPTDSSSPFPLSVLCMPQSGDDYEGLISEDENDQSWEPSSSSSGDSSSSYSDSDSEEDDNDDAQSSNASEYTSPFYFLDINIRHEFAKDGDIVLACYNEGFRVNRHVLESLTNMMASARSGKWTYKASPAAHSVHNPSPQPKPTTAAPVAGAPAAQPPAAPPVVKAPQPPATHQVLKPIQPQEVVQLQTTSHHVKTTTTEKVSAVPQHVKASKPPAPLPAPATAQASTAPSTPSTQPVETEALSVNRGEDIEQREVPQCYADESWPPIIYWPDEMFCLLACIHSVQSGGSVPNWTAALFLNALRLAEQYSVFAPIRSRMEKVLYKKAVQLLDAPIGDEWALATYLIIAQRFQSSTLMAPLVSSPSNAWWRPHLHHGSARRAIHDLLGKQGFRIFAYLAILYESGENLDAFEIRFNKKRAGFHKFYTTRSGWGSELDFVLLKDDAEVKV